MIYLNNRPVARKSQPVNVKRRFEWRDFIDGKQESVDLIRENFEFEKDEDRTDEYFLLPGRRDQITTLGHNETFEIRTLVSEKGPLELWETTVRSKIPMRRTLATRIASIIPKFSGPVVGSMTPEELSESLSKKSRFYRVRRKREFFRRGDVLARISKTIIGDQETLSIALESTKADPLMAELKTLGLRKRDNTHMGVYLLDNATAH